jgi:hypothetical protein
VVALTPRDATRLRAELDSELGELGRVVHEIESRRDARDDTTTYALALLLMNYYTGAERIFRRIAAHFGGTPPVGDRWHAQLLEDMALDLPAIRPPVLRAETVRRLERLLRLRHVLRNLYAWVLRRSELDPHVAEIGDAHAALASDLAEFAIFLQGLSAE